MTDAQHITCLLAKINLLEEENKNLCDRVNMYRKEVQHLGRVLEKTEKQLEDSQEIYRITQNAMKAEADRIEADWKENPEANYLSEITMLNRIQNALVEYWKKEGIIDGYTVER